MSKNIKSIFLMIAGGIAIILSIWCFTMSTGSTSSKNTYGGDAYTGMQNASAQAATNIVDLAAIAKKGFGSILLVAGIVLVIVGIPEKETDYKRLLNPAGNPNMNPQQPNGTYNQYNTSQASAMNNQYNSPQPNVMNYQNSGNQANPTNINNTNNQGVEPVINKEDSAEEIKKIKASLDAGEITQEEFDRKKRELLDI